MVKPKIAVLESVVLKREPVASTLETISVDNSTVGSSV